MNFKAALFDLDGTLTDSGVGITKSVANAFVQMGMEPPCQQELNLFVGPPLASSFARYGLNPEQVDEAIRLFRMRYTTIGKFENIPYPGITELLEKGLITSTSLLAVAPEAKAAAEYSKEKRVDVGVHLTINSDDGSRKWQSLSQASSFEGGLPSDQKDLIFKTKRKDVRKELS